MSKSERHIIPSMTVKGRELKERPVRPQGEEVLSMLRYYMSSGLPVDPRLTSELIRHSNMQSRTARKLVKLADRCRTAARSRGQELAAFEYAMVALHAENRMLDA